MFNLGDGIDTIYDNEGNSTGGKQDKIVFGEGIKAEDLRIERKGNNLEIRYSQNDKITIRDAYIDETSVMVSALAYIAIQEMSEPSIGNISNITDNTLVPNVEEPIQLLSN